MIATRKKTKEILEKYQDFAKKSFGQNFLIDSNVVTRIVKEAKIKPNSLVIEIGPGLGALTEVLAKHSTKVITLEIDPNMVKILEDTLISYDNVSVLEQDVLKADIHNILDGQLEGIEHIYCIANLPYYITTAIIVKLLETEIPFQKFVFMVQKEVAQRFSGKQSTKEYNALSVLMQYKTDVKVLFDVSSECFMPAPKVVSSVIEMVPKTSNVQAESPTYFYAFIKKMFANRRKTILNNLSAGYSMSKEKVLEVLQSQGMTQFTRAEELSVDAIVNLSNTFMKMFGANYD